MKTIIKILFIILCISFFYGNNNAYAQKTPVNNNTNDGNGKKPAKDETSDTSNTGKKKYIRPSDIGDNSIDNFVNQSFDVYEKTCKLDTQIMENDKKIQKMSAEPLSATPEDVLALKHDLIQMEGMSKSLASEYPPLLGQSEAVASNATKIVPATKAIKAVKNVKSATNALRYSGQIIPENVKKVSDQLARVRELWKD